MTTSPDTGQFCQCRKPHAPEPLVLNLHHILPQEFGGPTVPENEVWICPTTHTNVHEILRGMLDAKRELTYQEVSAAEDRHPVSRYAYDIAADGFRRIQASRPVIPAPTTM